MKKLSMVMAAAMCLTVGGVYATWTYSQGTATYSTKTTYVTLVDAATETAKGKIHIDATGVTIAIDQADDQYHGKLVFSTNHFAVSFVPTVGADGDVAKDGIKLTCRVTETYGSYGGYDIFTLEGDTENDGVVEFPLNVVDGEQQPVKPGVGCHVELEDILRFSSEITLPTAADYDAFNTYIGSNNCSITILVYETGTTPNLNQGSTN